MGIFTMALKFLFLFLTYAHISFASEEFRKRNEDIELSVGDSYEIAISEGTKIQISRKGIVDAQLLPKSLRIVALKTGIIVLTLSCSDEDDYKYFIHVQNKHEKPANDFDDLKTLTQNASLYFNEETQEISGSSPSYSIFYKAKKMCEERKTCSFQALLSEKARHTLTQSIEQLIGSKFEILVKENGAILILTPCGEHLNEKEQGKVVEHLISDSFVRRNLLIACKKEWHSGYYTLYSKMIVMENRVAKEIGLQTHLELMGSNSHFASNLDMDLSLALKNRKAKLVGEPVVWLLSGVEAHAQSGSELLMMKEQVGKRDSDSKSKYVWKELGLDLRVKLFPLDEKRVRLRYSFLVSNPASKEAGQIHVNKLESEVELMLEKASVVGGIQFKTSDDMRESTPFFESIPIVGPIFKRSGESESESNIFLYFYLTKPDSIT